MDSIEIQLGSAGLTPTSTLRGGNISPNITLKGVPAGLQYVALVVQNIADGGKTKCIWTIWNVPSVGYIPPGYEEGPAPKFPFPAMQGLNDFGEHKWHGPSPELGRRDKLLFQVFGRNEPLVLSPDAKMDEVIAALRDGKTVAYGSLEFFYQG